ncbi:ABC transporter substrate-binding protein [Modestobacter roseus]|uniref:NitT/TauT family transport system substrate-binding protein n=1 Tax=Modestobacter roseus TaxID=1181884 RepID=A0A562INB2_9ACTN|nr:ABC transporter substrate-binding protein [Modestobacter roseus]MQA34971.1 PhnD/SsuA/transferrin family substrate-binding protein [Modestobacter roseus]TWH72183.1 NitT/TauT family transport system substrate-binding protein [Modestobacter roseus]
MSHRPFTRRATTTVAGLAVVALAATGCGGDSDTEASGGGGEGGGTETVQVGTLPIANAAAMYLGMEQGFFEDEGLEIEPTVLQTGNDIITGLVSGDFDFGFVGYISAGIAAAQGVPVCVATASDATGTTTEDDWQVLVASGDSDISSAADLAGKTISVNGLGGVAEVMLKAALDQEGVDWSTVNLIEVPFPEVPAAVEAGRIDAGYTSEPFVTTVLDQGGKVAFAPQSTIAPEYPNGSYATSEQFVQQNPDVLERFESAMTTSLEYARENPDAIREIIPTYTQISEDVASRMRLPVYQSELQNDAIDQQMGFLETYDIVDEAPTADELVCG